MCSAYVCMRLLVLKGYAMCVCVLVVLHSKGGIKRKEEKRDGRKDKNSGPHSNTVGGDLYVCATHHKIEE